MEMIVVSNSASGTLDTQQIKDAAFSPGADLCGIASAERFAVAPEGFRPANIFPRSLGKKHKQLQKQI